MAPPGAQPDLADDATFDPRGHSRYNSTATQATLVADVAQHGANAVDRALKLEADSDDIGVVVDSQRFRVTAGTPSGPTAATTTVEHTGSSTAAAPRNVPSITAAALTVADPTTAAAAGPDEGPSGADVAGVADGGYYEDSSDDEFDYDQLDYDNVFSLPPGCKKIRIPIGQTGPNDVVDQNGRAWRVVRIDDVPPVCATDEDEDWVLSGGAHDDSAEANGEDNEDGHDNEDEGDNNNGNDGDDDEEGGNDLDSDSQPPAVLPKGPDAAGTIGWSDANKTYDFKAVAEATVAAGKVAPTVPLPPNFVRVPLRPEPDNILRPPWWNEELEKHIAAPLAPPDDAPPAPPVPRVNKRKRDEEEDEDEPAPRAPKKARRGKPLDIDELCARLAVIAWIIDVCGTCVRWTDGRRDLFVNANADDAEGNAGVDANGQHNSENGREVGAAGEHDGGAGVAGEHDGEAVDVYDEDADWVLQV